MTLALFFAFALLVSALLVSACRAVARRLGYVVTPPLHHSGHPAKALFGGVAIALTVFGCAAVFGAFRTVPVVLVCSATLFLVGLTSDLFSLRPSTKLVAVIAVASVFLFFDYRLHWTESLTIDSIATLFWIVGITTAFNLLDHMDGLCAGIALIAGTAFLLTILPVTPGTELFLRTQHLTLLLGAIAGFLVYDVHPSSIAMGESGSLLIGLNMAAMTLQIAPGRGSDLLSIIAVPTLLLLIPIVDATLATVSRLRAVRPADKDRWDYSSHRLVAIGLSQRAAVGLLWALAAASGLVAVAAGRNQQVSGLLVAMFTIGMALFAVYLARIRVHDQVEPNTVPATMVPLEIELGYRRRLTEVLLDLILVSVAYYGAFRLLFTPLEWAEQFEYFLRSYPIVVGTQIVALLGVGAYRGIWRYFSLSDGITFAKGVFVGVVIVQGAVLYLLDQYQTYSPPLFIIYGMLLLLLLVGSRTSFRLISEFVQRRRQIGRRLVIYGAGDGGAMAVRYLLADTRSAYRILGFVDDDVSKRHVRVHGYPVIGGYDHLVGMIMAGQVDAVALTKEGAGTSSLPFLCAKHGVALHRLIIDWHEVPVAEAETVAAAGGGAAIAVEPRVLRFLDARRDRGPAAASPAVATVGRPEATSPHPAPATPIRVVHIITRLILGGAQENTLYTAIGQHRDPRFDVTLLCGVDEAGEGDMFAEANRAGVTTVVLPSLVREIRPLTDVKAFLDMYRFLKGRSVTVVHTHSSKAGIIGRLAARAAGVPIVVHTLHGLVFHEFQSRWKNRFYILLKRVCAPMTDTIISVSDLVSKTALARGVGRPDQHITIYSGIDLNLFLSVGERLSVEAAKRLAGIPHDAPVVGKIARLFPLKGHEQFLAAAAEIHREMPEVFFLLVGDGPLREPLKAQAARLGIGDRVVMAGRVPPERVPDYIQAMDVVVHTSLREGIARVLPQAGAVGKPVVTFDLDGAPEVIRDGVSGYLVPPLDVAQVTPRTVELLRDPARRRSFGEAGRAFAAAHFSVERMVERIGAVYLDLLARVDARKDA